MRIDIYLAQSGMIKSRAVAKGMIINGAISVNGKVIEKPSFDVSENDDIAIIGDLPKYVSRGGLKLEKALACFDISVKEKCCLDIGASTGGFTDCLLQNGARYVYATDVGHDLIDDKIRFDERVCVIERMNIKNATLDDFAQKIEFICTDVSFISLKAVLPKAKELLCENGLAVLLIKPQFECGKSYIGKNGIVKSEKVHIRVIKEIIAESRACGFSIKGLDYSPICGGDGNIEFLIYLAKDSVDKNISIEEVVKNAHNKL